MKNRCILHGHVFVMLTDFTEKGNNEMHDVMFEQQRRIRDILLSILTSSPKGNDRSPENKHF